MLNTNNVRWLIIAVAAVGAFEGLRTDAYYDVGGTTTICYGETLGVEYGDTATKRQCDEMLERRLQEFNDGVNKCVHVSLPDSRRAAFVSLSYNIGINSFCKSTVVRKINAGDVVGSCNAMMMWNKVNGVEWKGLTKRRAKERELCLKGE